MGFCFGTGRPVWVIVMFDAVNVTMLLIVLSGACLALGCAWYWLRTFWEWEVGGAALAERLGLRTYLRQNRSLLGWLLAAAGLVAFANQLGFGAPLLPWALATGGGSALIAGYFGRLAVAVVFGRLTSAGTGDSQRDRVISAWAGLALGLSAAGLALLHWGGWFLCLFWLGRQPVAQTAQLMAGFGIGAGVTAWLVRLRRRRATPDDTGLAEYFGFTVIDLYDTLLNAINGAAALAVGAGLGFRGVVIPPLLVIGGLSAGALQLWLIQPDRARPRWLAGSPLALGPLGCLALLALPLCGFGFGWGRLSLYGVFLAGLAVGRLAALRPDPLQLTVGSVAAAGVGYWGGALLTPDFGLFGLALAAVGALTALGLNLPLAVAQRCSAAKATAAAANDARAELARPENAGLGYGAVAAWLTTLALTGVFLVQARWESAALTERIVANGGARPLWLEPTRLLQGLAQTRSLLWWLGCGAGILLFGGLRQLLTERRGTGRRAWVVWCWLWGGSGLSGLVLGARGLLGLLVGSVATAWSAMYLLPLALAKFNLSPRPNPPGNCAGPPRRRATVSDTLHLITLLKLIAVSAVATAGFLVSNSLFR